MQHGPVLVEAPSAEAATPGEVDRQLRIATDTATWLAETLHGSMRTEFEFTFDNGELRGEDGGLIDDVFDEAISEAREMTEWNPSMLFELRRRITEREELDDMYDMVNGNKPNTMIVISDFPPELMDAHEDVGGYNAGRKQTMMRIITLREGKLHILSQSLDGSNRQALEAIYEAMGEPVEEGEMLGQRIYRDLPERWQDNLADNLRDVYDASLAEQHGGQWHAGISQHPDRNITNTYEFVMQQQDLISWFTKEKLADSAGAEKYRYKVAATAKSRHERHLRQQNGGDEEPEPFVNAGHSSLVNPASLARAKGLAYEMAYEGRQAAARGDVFSGCGDTVTAEDSDEAYESSAGQLDSLGYGNRANDKSEKGVMRCVNCPECRTFHEELKAKNGVFRCKNGACGYTAKA